MAQFLGNSHTLKCILCEVSTGHWLTEALLDLCFAPLSLIYDRQNTHTHTQMSKCPYKMQHTLEYSRPSISAGLLHIGSLFHKHVNRVHSLGPSNSHKSSHLSHTTVVDPLCLLEQDKIYGLYKTLHFLHKIILTL